MNYSDDMEIRDNTQSAEIRQGFDAEKTPDEQPADTRNGFYGELVAISLKAVAVALSLVLLITSILAVALPLSAMRVFNKLGNAERALDFGDRYIARELNRLGSEVDDKGNYVGLAQVTATPDGFTEALDVSIGLAYKLADKYAAKGDKASTEYYARRLEQYTRMYLSLGDAATLLAAKDELRVNGVPSVAMRPFVYSYAHDLRVMNFRARAYLGETDDLLYNSRMTGDVVTDLRDRANTFANLDPNTDSNMVQVLDDFVDYAAQLGAYLSVELEKLGATGAYSESDIQNKYTNKLAGDEFSLIVSRTDGFSFVYKQLANFSNYAQAAYNYPASTFEERLRQLYWLRELSGASTKLWYTSMLLYYNRDMFGASKNVIADEYNLYNMGDGRCARYRFVWFEHNGEPRGILISDLYVQKFEQYLALIQSN